jgi:hypothetical protein
MLDSTWIVTPRLRRISLARINDVVSAHLGPTRVPGNAQPAAFNRQIAMYLAKHVSGWSTTVIGRFYNGRDHSTVCYALQRVEALRESSPEIDCLLSHLKAQLLSEDSILEEAEAMLLRKRHMSMRSVRAAAAREGLLNAIADRVAEWLKEVLPMTFSDSNPI